MANDDDAADAIKLTLSQIDDRLAQKPPSDEEKKLLEAKAALALQLAEIAEKGLDAGAKTVSAAAERLNAVIASANTLPFAEYWTKLQDALVGIGVARSDGGTNNSDGTTSPTRSSSGGTGLSGSWQQLVATYRSAKDISSDLKIASLAQWIVESGRGTSDLARLHNNFGGIKFRERMQGFATAVDYTGTDGETTAYCKFASVAAFIAGYWHFISSGAPYAGWDQYTDNAAGYIRFIAPNYAGDPAYVPTVLGVFQEAKSLLDDTGKGSSSPAPVPPAQPTSGNQARVAVVVGHNERAPGSSAGSPIFQTEFSFNSSIAALMKKDASQYNLQVETFIRLSDPSVQKEISIAYQKVGAWNPVCVVELHFNSSDDPSATGSEVLLAPNSPGALSLATSIANNLKSSIGLKLRGNQGLNVLSAGQRGWISVTALPSVPSVLCEPFFGSNPDDCLKIGTIGEEGLAIAYLRALREFVVAHGLIA